MYRRDLFAAKCDLFAYRYTDIDNSTKTFKTGLVYSIFSSFLLFFFPLSSSFPLLLLATLVIFVNKVFLL